METGEHVGKLDGCLLAARLCFAYWSTNWASWKKTASLTKLNTTKPKKNVEKKSPLMRIENWYDEKGFSIAWAWTRLNNSKVGKKIQTKKTKRS